MKLKIVVIGLSITSSWGNGHATTYRSLLKALAARGHSISFFEKDVPWYANHRDLPQPAFCRTILYRQPGELDAYAEEFASADLIILGSYVSDARRLTEQIGRLAPRCFAFYDIDTPVTLARLEAGDHEYLHPDMIPRFDLYLSFSGGRSLDKLEKLGARCARALYCSVDPELYFPEDALHCHDLGYLGTYSDDRQPAVDELLVRSAAADPDGSYCIAGAQYPPLAWPRNIERIEHIPPDRHRHFYNSQRFTLNITRRDMIAAGHSPSVRLFEAGACATPVISDYWEGLDSLFTIGEEILLARSSQDVQRHLRMPEPERRAIGQRMYSRVMSGHTSGHRAMELERYWQEVRSGSLAANS